MEAVRWPAMTCTWHLSVRVLPKKVLSWLRTVCRRKEQSGSKRFFLDNLLGSALEHCSSNSTCIEWKAPFSLGFCSRLFGFCSRWLFLCSALLSSQLKCRNKFFCTKEEKMRGREPPVPGEKWNHSIWWIDWWACRKTKSKRVEILSSSHSQPSLAFIDSL